MIASYSHTEKLLAFSVEQYRELSQHADKLMAMIDACDYSRVDEHAARLQELQAAASRQDELLLPLLDFDLPAWEGHALYRMRLKFINAILEANEALLPKIRGMQAVFGAELNQLKEGRVVVSGYGSISRSSGGHSRGVG